MWNAGQRLHSTLDEAVRRYPDDPEVWYELGEARYHVGFGAGASVTQTQVLDAFDRAVALDSGFAPALVSHTIECALRLQDVARARRYARAFLALGRDADYFPVVAFVANRLDSDRPDRRAGDSMLVAMSDGTLSHTLYQLNGWPDTAELEIAVARRLYDRDSTALWSLAWALTYRGHLREALPKTVVLYWLWGQLAVAGVVPPDTAGGRFALWLRQGEPWAGLALPWWSVRNDTISLLAFLRRAEAALRAAPRPRGDPFDQLGAWRYFGAAARAYLALAHRDTIDALKGFLALPDSVCAGCPPLTRLVTARLLGASRRDAEEAALLNRDVRPDAPVVDEPLWALERGRVNERLGNRTKAVAAYRFVAAVWVHADSQLQPYVAEARAALARLSAEPRQ